MQRLYGTAFLTEKELADHLKRLEEAKLRDHRKIGKDQKLFMFHQWAPGATFWLPKGTILYNILANYMREVLVPAGYTEVKAPIVFNKALWETSGHWQHYRENMFRGSESEGETMAPEGHELPRPHAHVSRARSAATRTCRSAITSRPRSTATRRQGVLSGLTRVRQFAQDDGHCFITQDQIGSEVEHVLRLVQRVYKDFGLTPQMKLSTRPPDFLGSIETWNDAEAQLKATLDRLGEPYTVNEGDGAFYGPEDRLRRHRRHRPEVAVRHHSARLPAARSGSTCTTSGPTTPTTGRSWSIAPFSAVSSGFWA